MSSSWSSEARSRSSLPPELHGDGSNTELEDLDSTPNRYPTPFTGTEDPEQGLLPQNSTAHIPNLVSPRLRPLDEDQSYMPSYGGSENRSSFHPLTTSYAALPQTSEPIQQAPPPLQAGASEPVTESEIAEEWTRRQASTAVNRGTTRRLKLIQGAVFSVEYPVPSAVRNAIQQRYISPLNVPSTGEHTHMRYTAATCDPNDFTIHNGYNLRYAMYNRHTEWMVAVTYYNEDKFLFSRTLHSIMQNARDIVNLRKSDFWNVGGPAYEKMVLCIVMDGIDPCDKDVLDVLATIGLFQDGVMKKEVDGKETVAHIFEYTTQLSVTASQQLVRPVDDSVSTLAPMQMILCLKQKNSKKLNSHRWVFNAFGRILNPEIIICLDAGTKPASRSLLRLWEEFYNHKDLGGCCGETRAMLDSGCKSILKPLIAAQNFEYKISYILDKPLESILGYVTVLPGAFSAYRYRAIMGRPLEEYFKGDPTWVRDIESSSIGGFVRNMFLAEDRILSFEMMMKPGSKWHTRYVKEALADTDIPEGMIEFINQRRRWLNGAFAVTIYTLGNFWRIHKSGHNLLQVLLLYFQMLYTIISLLLSWFSIAGFLLTTFIITDISGTPPSDTPARAFPFGKATHIFNAVIQTVYTATVILQFIMSLGGKAKDNFWGYATSFVIFGVVQFYFVLNAFYLMIRIFKNGAFDGTAGDYNYIQTFYAAIGNWTVLITCGSVFGVYYLSSFLYLAPWHMFFAYPQYLFVSSSYTNILNVYAFSRWNDVTWGEKQGKAPERIAETLPSAVLTTTPGQSSVAGPVFEEVDKVQEDIDTAFEAAVRRALRPYIKDKGIDSTPTAEELHSNFRTRLVATYLFSNFLLCILIMNDSFDSLKFLGNSYSHKVWFFRIWMWGTSVTFIIRFLGSCAFLLKGLRLCYFGYR